MKRDMRDELDEKKEYETAEDSLFSLVAQFSEMQQNGVTNQNLDVKNTQILNRHIQKYKQNERNTFTSNFVKFAFFFFVGILILHSFMVFNMIYLLALLGMIMFGILAYDKNRLYPLNEYFYEMGKIYKMDEREFYDLVLSKIFNIKEELNFKKYYIYGGFVLGLALISFFSKNILFLMLIIFVIPFTLSPESSIKKINK